MRRLTSLWGPNDSLWYPASRQKGEASSLFSYLKRLHALSGTTAAHHCAIDFDSEVLSERTRVVDPSQLPIAAPALPQSKRSTNAAT